MLALAAGVGAEFMAAEMQREAHLGDLDATELEAADAVPLADRRPAVAARGCAAAGARMKHVPDEAASRSRVFALDGDAEAPSPAAHHAVRARASHRLDDRLDDFVRGVAGAERDRKPGIGPDDRALL